MPPTNVTFNAANWNQVWIQPIGTTKETFTCPILLSSPIIAVAVNSTDVFASQFKGGVWIRREVASGLTVGGNADAKLDRSRKVYCNHLQIITFEVNCTYTLIANNLTYNANMFVWEYTGAIN